MAGRFTTLLTLLALGLSAPPRTAAQTPPPAPAGAAPAQPSGGLQLCNAASMERVGNTIVRWTGGVECEIEANGIRLSGDRIDYYPENKRLVAEGNVVFVSGDSRISAEKADFDTKSKTGTFFNASGSASVNAKVDRSFFGTQEPDAYFYGETIAKIGVDRYRITRGGFTTCVQPTPRWEVTASSVTLTLDKRAVLKNAVLKVKNVPMFYLPAMYYPINKEDRSTGFLLPVYTTSNLYGSSISNAFFWAINRSQDLTLLHDWYTRTGMAYGSEYRYVGSGGSSGDFRIHRRDERETTFEVPGRGFVTQPERHSFEIRASVVQALGKGFRARGNVDYFSDVTAQQQYQMNLYDASLRTRTYQGNIAGSLGKGNTISGSYGVSEIFYGDTDSQTIGGRPRIQFTRALAKLGPLPVYFAAGGEYVNLVRVDKRGSGSSLAEYDQSLIRFDASPTLSMPLTKWPFMSLRSSVSWRNTYWTESIDGRNGQVDEPIFRQYFDMRTSFTGPILTRVWNTPKNGYAERFKHVFEPEFIIQRTTEFEDYDRIVKIEGADYTYGGTTRITYGLTNRLLARRRAGADGAPAARVREFLNVQIQQSYYSNPQASQVDGNYSGGFFGRPASNFSPIAMIVRANPTNAVGAALRLEYNDQISEFETIQINASYNAGSWLTTSGGWSQRKYVYGINPLYIPPNNFLSSRTNVSLKEGRFGGAYHFDMNLTDYILVQQRIGFFYNAQCCGIGFEYQEFNYPNLSRFVISQDRRFSLSFTLAGVGSFSNILGAFGIGQGALGTTGRAY